MTDKRPCMLCNNAMMTHNDDTGVFTCEVCGDVGHDLVYRMPMTRKQKVAKSMLIWNECCDLFKDKVKRRLAHIYAHCHSCGKETWVDVFEQKSDSPFPFPYPLCFCLQCGAKWDVAWENDSGHSIEEWLSLQKHRTEDAWQPDVEIYEW